MSSVGNRQGLMFIIHRIKVTGGGEPRCRVHFSRHRGFLLCGEVFRANLELPKAADTFK